MSEYIFYSDLESGAENAITVKSTSQITAECSEIELAKTETLCLKFIPKLVDNPKDRKKSLSGKFLFERKHRADDFFPSEMEHMPEKISRRTVKVCDSLEFALSTDETYALYEGLKERYQLFGCLGQIPLGNNSFIKIDNSLRSILSLIKDNPEIAQTIGNKENYDLFKTLLRLLTKTESLDSLKKSLSELQDDNLQHLTTSLNIEKLKRTADLMKSNLDNPDEEFWQTSVFKQNQWVLAQLFSCPCTIFEDKAYVGGKNVSNHDGKICDFLYKNGLSQNIALIEIKTPCTKIIDGEYRNGAYSFSSELTGAISQVLNYKDSITKGFYELCRNDERQFEVVNPRCIVVIGKLSTMSKTEIAAFENFRNSLNNILVITFDELHQRIVNLITAIENEPSH